MLMRRASRINLVSRAVIRQATSPYVVACCTPLNNFKYHQQRQISFSNNNVRTFTTSAWNRQQQEQSADLIANLTKENYNQELSNNGQVLILDFTADWCGPCQTFTPLLEKLVREKNGVFKLLKVNTDVEKEIAGAFKVSSLPTLYFLFRKKIVGQKIEGALPEAEISAIFDQVLAATQEELSQGTSDATSEQEGPRTPQQKLDIAKQLVGMDQIAKAQSLLAQILTDDAPKMDSTEKSKIIPSVYASFAMTYLLSSDMEQTKDLIGRIQKEYPAAMESNPEVRSTASLYEVYIQAGDQLRYLASELAQSMQADSQVIDLVENHPFSREMKQRIEQNPKDYEAYYQLSIFYFLNGLSNQALDTAFNIAKKSIRWNDYAAKKLILNFANILADKKEAEATRRKLAMYLYV